MRRAGRWLFNFVAVVSLLVGYATLSLGAPPIDMAGVNFPVGRSRVHFRVDGAYVFWFWTGPYDEPWAHEIWGTNTWYIGQHLNWFPVWPFLLLMMAWPIYFWRKPLLRLGARERIPQARRFFFAIVFSHMIASYAFFIMWDTIIPLLLSETLYSDLRLIGDRLPEAPLRTLVWFPRAAFLIFSGSLNSIRFAEYAAATAGYLAVAALAIWVVYFRISRRAHRILHGLCPACGYDLRATPARCPECGAIPEGAKGAAT
jgi:hypothetical protein